MTPNQRRLIDVCKLLGIDPETTTRLTIDLDDKGVVRVVYETQTALTTAQTAKVLEAMTK